MPLPTVPGASAPFRLNWLPLEAFSHPSWERAKREALAAVARGDRTLLLGPPGTGKTLLLQDLGRLLRARGAATVVLRQGEKLAAAPGTAVLLVDEAGSFSDEDLARMSRWQGGVIIAGLPGLQQRTAGFAGPVGIVTLEPLAPEEVARFVIARLDACGRPRDLFTPEAVAAIARHSDGMLRLIIILAGAALFFAELRGAARVACSDVDEAAAMRAAVTEEEEPEASRSAAPHPATLPAEPALTEAPPAEPAWLHHPVGRTRFWPVARVAAGLAGVASAALAVAALAIAAALAVSSAPAIPLSLEALKGGSAPPPIALVPPPLVQLAAAPPQPSHAALPPAPNRAPAPAPAATRGPAPAATPAPEPAQAQAALPSPRVPLSPPLPAPPDAADQPEIVLAFSGPILNDTMGQGGRLSLQLRTDGAEGPVGAWFHASHGLIGTGTLRGKMRPDGRITLSGRLMMGQNPFDCALNATLDGDRLVGEATFVRATSGAKAHSSFTLTRLSL